MSNSNDSNVSKTNIIRRKKVPLPPGFSQMDWMRRTNQNSDLTGVSKEEKEEYHKNGGVKMEIVNLHNKKEDCWMVINGKVFDVTEYVPFHPGGLEILEAAGKDGTSLFNEIHPWVNISFILKSCYIADLTK